VSEWVHDYSVNNLGSAAVTDPWGATSGTRVYRGGSYFYGLKYLRAAYRDSWTPTGTSTDIGFRCARSK
jgi:formylglycine-generating enzyme required for sulfatase activity